MSIEAMKQALEALYDSVSDDKNWIKKRDSAVIALRRAIEQAEKQEPVAWVCEGFGKEKHNLDYAQEDIDALEYGTPLYTTPPQADKTHTDHPMRHWDRTCPACLAEKQEPVAWINFNALTGERTVDFECASELASEPLYTKPHSATHSADSAETFGKREWVWLTDDDRIEIAHSMDGGIQGFLMGWGWLNYAKALETKSKEKNT